MSTFRSPNEMLEAGSRIMLDGRKPETSEDWQLIVNFWAVNIHPTCCYSAIRLMLHLYKVDLPDSYVKQVCEHHASHSNNGQQASPPPEDEKGGSETDESKKKGCAYPPCSEG